MKLNLPKIVTAITVIVSVMVMFGWFLDISILKSIIPGGVQMKFITALMFLASAIIVYYASTPPTNINRVVSLGFSSAFIFFILMLLSLVYFGFDTGIGQLFVREAPDAVKTVTPGYPSAGTMVAFFLITFAGPISLYLEKHKTMMQVLSGSISAIGGIALMGHLFDIPVLYYYIEGISGAIAVNTAILFVLIGVGLWQAPKYNAIPSNGDLTK